MILLIKVCLHQYMKFFQLGYSLIDPIIISFQRVVQVYLQKAKHWLSNTYKIINPLSLVVFTNTLDIFVNLSEM